MRKYVRKLIPLPLRQRVREDIEKFVPPSLRLARNHRMIIEEEKELNQIAHIACETNLLAFTNQINLDEIFSCERYAQEWREIERDLASLSIKDTALGGANPGDRRVIYYLIRHLRPRSVLEIGTHIGASTVYAAMALRMLKSSEAEPFALTTVDIRDVNDLSLQPWLAFGSTHSPMTMIKKLGCDDIVTFVTENSINYLKECQSKYDFIFLDGDHSAPAVYREIAAALSLLNEGGTILLHDYYPKLEPLWSDGILIPGPVLATQRLQTENINIKVLPLGKLPWPTKLNSHLTSLALLGRRPLRHRVNVEKGYGE